MLTKHQLPRVYWVNGYNQAKGHFGAYWREDEPSTFPTSIFSEDLTPLDEFEKHRPNKIQDNDVIYFTKTSKIPRFKYKDFIEGSGLKVKKTNRIDTANTYITNLNEIKNLYKGNKFDTYYIIPINDIRKHVDPLKLKFYSGDVLVKYSDDVAFPLTQQQLSQYKRVEAYFISRGWGENKEMEAIDSYNYLTSKLSTCKIIFDETITETANEGTVIDEEVYHNMVNMLKSTDEGNISLAMEIMSNADFVKSKHYILFLLNEFNDKFTSTNKTQNFNNCLRYFRPYKYYVSWDAMVNAMMSEEMNEDEALLVKKYVMHRLNGRFGKYFKVNDINVSVTMNND
jgi:hypothetical protein